MAGDNRVHGSHDAQRQEMAQTRLILDSFERLLGRPLINRTADAHADAQALYDAPFAVLSHDTQSDPILNYANATTLRLWQTTPETLFKTPSRLTAEPMARDARDRVMAEVTAKGFISGYEGVRISATGRRFEIRNVIIWNLYDATSTYAGQAATFDQWKDL